jgi:FHA domain
MKAAGFRWRKRIGGTPRYKVFDIMSAFCFCFEIMIRRFTIGRDRTTDIPVADESVSRFHAEIWLAPDGALILADRGSSNGTELIRDGQPSPLRQSAVLPTDQVRFGGATFTVKELIEAVELKHPGGLTGPTEVPKAAPPPIPSPPQVLPPPLAMAASSPAGDAGRYPPPSPSPPAPPRVPPSIPSGYGGQYPPSPPPLPAATPSVPSLPSGSAGRYPPAPPPLSSPPPLPGAAQTPPGIPASSLVRCDCGALKTLGQACPRCQQ